MANVYDFEKRLSVSTSEQPQVATFVIDFDAQEFTSTVGSTKKVRYASGDVVRLMDAVPTGKSLVVFASQVVQDVASTADTSSTIIFGKDGGSEIHNSYDGKTAAATVTTNALAAPVFLDAGKYLTAKNTIVEATAGAKLKGKITFSVVYCLI